MRIVQVAWVATDNEKATPSLSAAGNRSSPPVHAVANAKAGEAAPGSGAADEVNPPFAGGRYEIAMLEGSVRVAGNDYRGAVAQVQKLADELGAPPGFRADVIDSPLDVRPTLGLQGRHAERDPDSSDARFVIRVLRDRSVPT
jgi:hypothetical protein